MRNVPQGEPLRMLQVRIGETIFRGLKAAAGSRPIPMQEWVAEAVREKLDRDNPEWLSQLPEPEPERG